MKEFFKTYSVFYKKIELIIFLLITPIVITAVTIVLCDPIKDKEGLYYIIFLAACITAVGEYETDWLIFRGSLFKRSTWLLALTSNKGERIVRKGLLADGLRRLLQTLIILGINAAYIIINGYKNISGIIVLVLTMTFVIYGINSLIYNFTRYLSAAFINNFIAVICSLGTCFTCYLILKAYENHYNMMVPLLGIFIIMSLIVTILTDRHFVYRFRNGDKND